VLIGGVLIVSLPQPQTTTNVNKKTNDRCFIGKTLTA